MLEQLNSFILTYNRYIGTYLILATLVPTGIFYAFRLKFIHLTLFFHAYEIISGKYDHPKAKGDVSHFKALTTALSATVGTGNIVGVSLAIYYGGPGAIFWMWVTGFFGMILKFVECTLSQMYRKVDENGDIAGGPMYYIEMALTHRIGKFAKVLAIMFATATLVCSIGTGNMTQSNSISEAFFQEYGVPNWLTAITLATVVFLVIVGGIKRIASVTAALVPLMAGFYLISTLLIVYTEFEYIPYAFKLIFHGAFNGTAAAGGFIGSTFLYAARFGIARGLFSNEAGQGSAAIAHAASRTRYPIREGLVASTGPFIDTILICTMTALSIILTDAWKQGLKGVNMTIYAFDVGLEPLGIAVLGEHIVVIGIFLFAISTAISWSYYGDRAVTYLFGEKGVFPYRVIYCIFTALGAVWGMDFVWNFTDMAITFMTLPNLIALVLLSPVVAKEAKEYLQMYRNGEFVKYK